MILPQTKKNKLAIVVVGFNKLIGLGRLLNSLNTAFYDSDDVPLYISIDASGNGEVYNLANTFEWLHGTKYVNIEKERLGLKKHIFQCASLASFFRGVMILEDDIFVSPFFYHYGQAALNYYENDEKIAGISLYAEETNGYVGLPFQPEQNQYDVYAWQTVCSWGQIWNERMWKAFTTWLGKWDEDFAPIDMIGRIKKWKRAWSKYYYAYMIENDKYFIYPYQSLTTNFNDAGGEHGGGDNSIVQVSLLQGKRNYQFGDFDSLVKYDVYAQNLAIPQWLGLEMENLTVDFYGLKDLYRGEYILSPFELPYEKVKSFGLFLRPWELNVKFGIDGNILTLYRKKNNDVELPPKRKFSVKIAKYYLRGFNTRLLDYVEKESIIERIKHKLHL